MSMGDIAVLVGCFAFLVILVALAKMHRQMSMHLRFMEAMAEMADSEAQGMREKTSSLESKLDALCVRLGEKKAERKEQLVWKV